MATKLEASRLLTEQAAIAYDSGIRSDLQAGMAKLFATETALSSERASIFLITAGSANLTMLL